MLWGFGKGSSECWVQAKKIRCHLQGNSYSQLQPAWAFEYESFHIPTQHAQGGAHCKPKDEKIWYERRVDVSLTNLVSLPTVHDEEKLWLSSWALVLGCPRKLGSKVSKWVITPIYPISKKVITQISVARNTRKKGFLKIHKGPRPKRLQNKKLNIRWFKAVTFYNPQTLKVTNTLWKGHVFTIPKKRHEELEGWGSQNHVVNQPPGHVPQK